ncbi:MAG: DUF3500 domain-containing protein [Gammaproteobacteria bacterium]|nr:DUF3500 domain-containing protein [Gammaproteobacteria bacterium]MDH5302912.1 DUF3500 domain-containing protein [Gammaproteobacteria bacterium]MDH5321017.1 DUF3500 domain-containing protein [Gammaproteobacteria bacterium]
MYNTSRRCRQLILFICALPFCATAHVPTVAERMQEAALELLQSLDAAQRSVVQYAWDDAARFRWSNLPASMVAPDGIRMVDLDDTQRQAVFRLLAASLSSQGYAKVTGIVRSDDVLRETMSPQVVANPTTDDEKFLAFLVAGYFSGNYGVAIYGDPAGSTWGWQIDGHHVGANFTVADGLVSFTPLFLGSNPMRLQSGPMAGWMPLPLEGRRGLDLLNSLDEEQRATAIISDEKPADILSGPGRQDSLSEYEGLKADRLSAPQMRLLKQLVAEYALNGATGDELIAVIEAADWEELHFSWHGPTGRDDAFYYRVHGPRVLIEYSRLNPNHEHTILRDPRNDFGADWLGKHYSESHPPLDKVMEDFRERAGIRSDD